MGLIAKMKDAMHHDANHASHSSSHSSGLNQSASSSSLTGTDAHAAIAPSSLRQEEIASSRRADVAADAAAVEDPLARDNRSTVVNPANNLGSNPSAIASAEAAETNIIDRGIVDEQRVVKDAVVQEDVRRHQHEKIQPVIEREKADVHVQQRIQPVFDRRDDIAHREKINAPLENRVVESIPSESTAAYQANADAVQSSQRIGEKTHSAEVHAPIVNEVREHHLVDEVQPVIQREVNQHTTLHTTQPIKESYVAAPKVGELRVEAPISIEEFQQRHGTLLQHGHHAEAREARSEFNNAPAAINTANVREP